MNELLKRSLTGLVYVMIVVVSTIFHPILFAVVFAGFLGIALFEFYSMSEKMGAKPQKTIGLISAVVLFLIFFLSANKYATGGFLYFIALIPLFILLHALFNKRQDSFRNTAATLLGIVYVALPFSLLNHILIPNNAGFYPGVLMGTFLIIWMFDSMAYVTGSSFGKHKICTKISPGKSWEGLIGGAVFAVLMGILNAVLFNLLDIYNWIIISLLIVIFGTLGDFFESKLKREAGIKDSGIIMPGHGGMLDRFDSLLFVAPVIFAWLHLFCKL